MTTTDLPRAPSSFVARFFEFLTLRYAAAVAEKTPSTIRDAAKPDFLLGRQKHEAAEALWSTGNYAEAITLAKQALDVSVLALAKVNERTEPGTNDELASWLRARGATDSRIKLVTRVLERSQLAKLPALDADVTSEHDDLHRDLLAARLVVDDSVRKSTMRPREVTGARVKRVLIGLFSAVLVIGVAAFLFKPPAPLVASCSAHWNNVSDSAAANAIDGDLDTEWSAPDRTPAWIEVALQPARHVDQLRVMNGRNKPWNDRGTLAFHVDVIQNGRVAKNVTGTFGQWQAEPNWKEVGINLDDVERIRIYADTWHAQGASIAELEVK